jgi:hypothetical protein
MVKASEGDKIMAQYTITNTLRLYIPL